MKGRIVRWEDSKGFGFIKSAEHGKDIFIHVTNFRQGQRRPKAGDMVQFELDISNTKSTAIRAKLVGVPATSNRRNPSLSIVFGTILLPLAIWLYVDYLSQGNQANPADNLPGHHQSSINPSLNQGTATPAKREALGPRFSNDESAIYSRRPAAQKFACQGKQYCSDMRSCEEATFYLNHCPNVKIDGDRDGIPCEAKLCKI